MKQIVHIRLALVVVMASGLYVAATHAQTAAPTAPAATAPVTPAPTPAAGMEMTKDGKPKAKAVREACRAEADGKGLKGMDKQKAVSDCLVKQRPDLAGKEQCRMDGREKGLKQDELKAYVKDCAKTKG